MQAELKILGILEGEVDKKLIDCRKKITLFTVAKKQMDIEAQQATERKLLRIKKFDRIFSNCMSKPKEKRIRKSKDLNHRSFERKFKFMLSQSRALLHQPERMKSCWP